MSVINEYTYIYSSNIRARRCYFWPRRLCTAMLFSAAAIVRGNAIFGHGDRARRCYFRPWRSPFSRLGDQYKFTESSGISGCCLSWAGISLWLGCARILVSLFGFERGAI